MKSQFRDYVLGPIAHGSISTSGGAGASGSVFTFPQSASAIDAASGLGTASFRGSVRFTGHAGALSVLVGDPWCGSRARPPVCSRSRRRRARSTSRPSPSARRRARSTRAAPSATPGSRRPSRPPVRPGSPASTARATPSTPVSFTVGADNRTDGRGGIRHARPTATTANTPDATPPATDGVELERRPVAEGGAFTFTADGFQPNETGILVVIYSSRRCSPTTRRRTPRASSRWTGALPTGLTGEHTLTFQGSVDRGIVLDIAAAEDVGCPVESRRR